MRRISHDEALRGANLASGATNSDARWTVLLLEGRTPKRAVGVMKSPEEAEAWARQDGWQPSQYKIIPLDR
jgi:hypothetical protein